MTGVRISAAAFLGFVLYMLFEPIVFPFLAGPAGSETSLLAYALSLGWYFALWSALVAAMIFTIAWAATGMAQEAEQNAGEQRTASDKEAYRHVAPSGELATPAA